MSSVRQDPAHRGLPMLVGLVAIALGAPCSAQQPPILEASGITRYGDDLLIVDDGQRGSYFRFPLKGQSGPVIVLDPNQLERVELPHANMATDLESIDVLADGRVVVLSERLRALFGSDGPVADYDAPLSEFGKRGLEGVAVRRLEAGGSRVAVLWEGGYPEYLHVPQQLRRKVGRTALQPIIQTHTLSAEDRNILVRGSNYVRLDVPLPSGRQPRAQRFRAPDLVWHRSANGAWGFIALLASQNSTDRPTYLYHWLQRFSLQGKRIGEPLDLDQLCPEELKGVNWEGLGWFEEGKSLVIVHESHPEPNAVAYVLELPEEWQYEPAPTQHYTHWIENETVYYLSGPQQARSPDGTLRPGTRVKILENAASYCRVRTDDDLVVYVATARLKPYQQED